MNKWHGLQQARDMRPLLRSRAHSSLLDPQPGQCLYHELIQNGIKQRGHCPEICPGPVLWSRPSDTQLVWGPGAIDDCGRGRGSGFRWFGNPGKPITKCQWSHHTGKAGVRLSHEALTQSHSDQSTSCCVIQPPCIH